MKLILGNLRKDDKNSSLFLLLKGKINETLYEIQYDKDDIIEIFILYLLKINIFGPCIIDSYKTIYIRKENQLEYFMIFDYLYKFTKKRKRCIQLSWINLILSQSNTQIESNTNDKDIWKLISFNNFNGDDIYDFIRNR